LPVNGKLDYSNITIGGIQANILQLHHLRSESSTPLLQTRVELELETRGWEHAEEIKTALGRAGYATAFL
jgi:threonine dehydratase